VGEGTGLFAAGALLLAAAPESFNGAAALLGAPADAPAATPGGLCSALQALSASAQAHEPYAACTKMVRTVWARRIAQA
jgi:hypothetical protein